MPFKESPAKATCATASSASRMRLTSGPSKLPKELIGAIADQLDDERDILNLALTCKANYNLMIRKDWWYLNITANGSHIAEHLSSMIKAVKIKDHAVSITVTDLSETVHFNDGGLGNCNVSTCTSCTLARLFAGPDLFVASNKDKFTRDFRGIAFEGYFNCSWWSGESEVDDLNLPQHRFLRARGMRNLAPAVFRFNMDWRFWHFALLDSFSFSKLEVLKVPVRFPKDCMRLGQALLRMARLQSLTVVDLPDHDDFLIHFPILGQNILACQTTLRSLDLSMTNYNRQPDWEEDESFAQAETTGFHFNLLFPQPNRNMVIAQNQLRFLDPRDDIHREIQPYRSWRAPLQLKNLRLKHIDIPDYAFRTVFQAACIREIRIPFCDVAAGVWEELGFHAQLRVLEDVNYELVTPMFLAILHGQTELRSLSFSRPSDLYEDGEMQIWEPGTFKKILNLKKKAAILGPATAWGFDKNQRNQCSPLHVPTDIVGGVINALEQMPLLQNLVLPADMLDTTPNLVSFLGDILPNLGNIEWGFDYSDINLQKAFRNGFLKNKHSLKRITFQSLYRPRPLSDFDALTFHFDVVLPATAEGNLPATLKYLRYTDLMDQTNGGHGHKFDVFHNRELIDGGHCWMRYESEDAEKTSEGEMTSRIVPVGKW